MQKMADQNTKEQKKEQRLKLKTIADNAFELAVALADRALRDEVLISGVNAYLDTVVWIGDDAIPTTLADAKDFVQRAEVAASPFWPKKPTSQRRR